MSTSVTGSGPQASSSKKIIEVMAAPFHQKMMRPLYWKKKKEIIKNPGQRGFLILGRCFFSLKKTTLQPSSIQRLALAEYDPENDVHRELCELDEVRGLNVAGEVVYTGPMCFVHDTLAEGLWVCASLVYDPLVGLCISNASAECL
jgi:hypothetical protein